MAQQMVDKHKTDLGYLTTEVKSMVKKLDLGPVGN